MVFNNLLFQTKCTSTCGCSQLTLEQKLNLIIFDYSNIDWEVPLPTSRPRILKFKYPSDFFGHSFYMQSAVPSLQKMTFQILAILVENFVRRTFHMAHLPNVIHWHVPQFALASALLENVYGFPSSLARSLLPRFAPRVTRRLTTPYDAFRRLMTPYDPDILDDVELITNPKLLLRLQNLRC